jgi:hypothetical protein
VTEYHIKSVPKKNAISPLSPRLNASKKLEISIAVSWALLQPSGSFGSPVTVTPLSVLLSKGEEDDAGIVLKTPRMAADTTTQPVARSAAVDTVTIKNPSL